MFLGQEVLLHTTKNRNGAARSGIGRRRGAHAKKSHLTSAIVIIASCSAVLLLLLLIIAHVASVSKSNDQLKIEEVRNHLNHLKDLDNTLKEEITHLSPAEVAQRGDKLDEEMSDEFHKWSSVIRADLNLIAIQTAGSTITDGRKTPGKIGTYSGVRAVFCKLDWEKYKADPPSLPMFKFLVSASGCDDPNNTLKMDLATAVKKTKEYDKIRQMQTHSDGIHVIPPSGFVFHESRVGSTLVANALTAMAPTEHRVYSESHPINDALRACGGDGGDQSSCDVDANAQLFRDVVYLMGRTASPKENKMFFKVSSVGSKRIHIMQKAFPDVPWMFVYRDPVQTMMSHLDPTKLKKIRGGGSSAVCLRAKRNPPDDIKTLVQDHGGSWKSVMRSDEDFCAAHLATLCESALRALQVSDGKGVSVDYDGLVDNLIETVIPTHFGVPVDDVARQRIMDVSKIYSKSKPGQGHGKDWVEDSKTKDERSTDEIRSASEQFLKGSYTKLKGYNINS